VADQNLDIVIRVRGGQVAASEIKGVSTSVAGVGTTTEETTKKTSRLGSTLKGLAGAFAAYKAYSYVKGAVTETTNLAKATAGLQRITGMDTQTSAGWVALAKERGIQSKQLNQGFITLARNISGAAQGSKSSAKAFAQLGLNAQALKQQTPTVQLSMLADSFTALPAGVDKAALAQKLFGRQAQSLLPLLSKGGRALDDQVTELGKQTGMTNSSMKSTLSLVASQRQLHAATLGLQVAIGTALIPILQTAAQVITPIASAFSRLMQGSQAFRVAVVALTAGLTAYIAITKLAAMANITLEASIAPIAAIVVGLGFAFVMLYQRCAWFRNAVQAAMHAVVTAVMWVKNAAVAVFDWVKGHWPLLAAILAGPFGLVVLGIVKNLNTIKSVASAVWGAVKTAVSAVISPLQTVFNTLWRIANLPSKAFGALGKLAGGVTGAIGSVLPHFQAGGHVSAPTLAVVGEAGPEVVALPGGATVHPNGGFGGVVHTHVYIGPREIAHAVGSYVAGQQAAR
jgi:hypothetical protein